MNLWRNHKMALTQILKYGGLKDVDADKKIGEWKWLIGIIREYLEKPKRHVTKLSYQKDANAFWED